MDVGGNYCDERRITERSVGIQIWPMLKTKNCIVSRVITWCDCNDVCCAMKAAYKKRNKSKFYVLSSNCSFECYFIRLVLLVRLGRRWIKMTHAEVSREGSNHEISSLSTNILTMKFTSLPLRKVQYSVDDIVQSMKHDLHFPDYITQTNNQNSFVEAEE